MILHRNDILTRLCINPEPPEVTEMRRHILASFQDLEFYEEGHKYLLNGQRIPSVSSLIEDLSPKQDWERIKANKAKKEGCTVEDLTRLWEENNIRSTNNGSLVHLYGESMMKFVLGEEVFDPIIQPQYEKGYLIPFGPKEEAVQKYWQDIFACPTLYPLIPEVKMYMPVPENKFGINKIYCGTADITLAFKQHGEWCILVQDFKTNSDLKNQYVRDKKKMMLQPFNDILDEPLGHYTLQLSLYSLMLMNLGYKVIDRRLIWLKEDKTYDKIALPDITGRLIKYLQ